MKNSFYGNICSQNSQQLDFSEIIERIQNLTYGDQVTKIKMLAHADKKDEANELKKKLPAFTPSGTFEGLRVASTVVYNQLVHLDFDGVEPLNIQPLRETINACSLTHASFLSPSGKGIKVFIKVNSNAHEHKECLEQIMLYYEQLTGVSPDKQCTDINRLCFMSSDDECYYDPDSEVFSPEFEMPDAPQGSVEAMYREVAAENIPNLVEYTNRIKQYVPGSRNQYIYLLACNANRAGIKRDDILDYCLSNYDLPQKEIHSCIRGAYERNVFELGKFSIFGSYNDYQIAPAPKLDPLLSSPYIPISVYNNVPNILSEASFAFEEARERDVFFTSALSILSGCLPKVSGEYGQKTVYPNLFTFILAPAANGKGSMTMAKMLADTYHEFLKNQSISKASEYKTKLQAYKKQVSAINSKNIDQIPEEPIKPPFKVVFIPANTSSAKLYEHLRDNGEFGIICETEADTLGIVFKNEWGSYSDLLRKSFHHEKASISRKTDNEYIDINNPRLSIALSGTINQVFNIIQSAEDGLFSRFIFYIFKSENKWMSPAPKVNGVNLTDHFKQLSQRVFEMVQFLENSPTIIKLSDNQWQQLDYHFDTYLKEFDEIADTDASSVVKRMGLILYRICMVLTAIRKFENGDLSPEVTCEDIDFNIALELTDVYIQHSLLMYKNLPKQEGVQTLQLAPTKTVFFKMLPAAFKRKEAIDIAQSIGISIRMADDYLKKWCDTLLCKKGSGHYVKIK
jgi:hypothetical protein